MLMRRTYFFAIFVLTNLMIDSAVTAVQMNLAASRMNKGVSPLVSGAFISASRLQIPTKCCLRRDGSAELTTRIKCLQAEPLVLVCLRPIAFVGTPEILCLLFLRKRLVIQSESEFMKVLLQTIGASAELK